MDGLPAAAPAHQRVMVMEAGVTKMGLLSHFEGCYVVLWVYRPLDYVTVEKNRCCCRGTPAAM